jgi:hypothetical protein
MKAFFNQVTWFRLYAALCVLALSVFTYAEYYGYALTGSDESTRSSSTSRYYSGSGPHHK